MATGTSATVEGGIWSFDNGTATYTSTIGGASTELFTISGLSTGGISASDFIATTTFDSQNHVGTITLSKKFLGSSSVVYTDKVTNDDYNYHLALSDDVQTVGALDATTFNISYSGTSATIEGKLKTYYTLSDNQIDYHAPGASGTLAVINGISSGVTSGIAFSGGSASNILSLSNNVFAVNSGITLTTGYDNDKLSARYGFKLALAEDNGNGIDGKAEDGKIGLKDEGNSWSIASDSTTAIYQHITTQYWQINGDSSQITYGAAINDSLVKVEGLSTVISVGDSSAGAGLSGNIIANGNSGIVIDDTASIVTFYSAVLSKDSTKSVTITGNNYTFKLAKINNDDNDDKIGFAKGDNYWTFSSGSAFYKYDTAEGWQLSNKQINYTNRATTTLASITGLSANLATSAGSLSAIPNISIADGGTVFSLGAGAFNTSGGDSSTVKLSGTGYTLALAGSSLNTVAKVDITKIASLSYANGGLSATIQGDVLKYYDVATDSKSITYFAPKSNVDFATITGLSSSASGSSALKISNTTITLYDEALGSGNIEITKSSNASDIPDYTFSLSGLSNKVSLSGVYDSNEAASVASVSGGTATIMGTARDWYSLGTSGTSVIHNSASSLQIGTITGLGTSASTDNVSFSGASIIVLTKDALTGSTANYINLNLDKDADNKQANFKLALGTESGTVLNTSTVGYDKSQNYWSVGSTTVGSLSNAIYQYHINEGWKLTGIRQIKHDAAQAPTELLTIKNLASDGLSTTGKDDGVTIGGISITTDGGISTVVLSKNVLSKDTANPIELLTTQNYKIALGLSAGGNSTVLGIEKDEDNKYWHVYNGDARLQYDTSEGWKVESTKIRYSAEKTGDTGTGVATIKGLSAGISDSGLSTALEIIASAGTSTIKLTASVLDPSKDVSLVNEAGYSYKFDLSDDSITNITNKSASTALHFKDASDTVFGDDSIADGNALIKTTRAAGWSYIGSESTSLRHYGQINDTLATISGLSTAGLSNYLTLSDKVVSVSQSALTNKNVTLTNADTNNYSLSLAGNSATFGFANKNNEAINSANVAVNKWTVTEGTDSSSAVLTHTTGQGWSLAGGGKSIIYSGESTVALVSITGLNKSVNDGDLIKAVHNNAGTSNVLFDGDIILAQSLLGANDLTLNLSGGASYKLKLTTGTDSSVDTLGFENKNDEAIGSGNVWSVTGTDNKTAYLVHTTGQGWSLSGNSIIYSGESTATLATITGLNSTVNANTLKSVLVPNAATSTVPFDGSIVLTQAMLGKGPISLSSGALGANYSLSLANSSGSNVTELGFKYRDDENSSVANAWSFEGTTAYYTHTTGEGWSLSGNTIIYSSESPVTVASITGLKSDLTKKELNSIKVEPETTTPDKLFDGKIYLTENLLGNGDISLSSGGLSADYKLSFDDYANNNPITKLGFGGWGDDGNNSWTLVDDDFVYRNTTDKGWTLNSNKLSAKFTDKKVTDIVTIKGLKSDTRISALDDALTEVKGTSASSVFDGTIVLKEAMLGDGNISLVSGSASGITVNYSLSFINSSNSYVNKLGFEKGNSLWSVSGTDAVYQFETAKGWELGSGSKSATFSDAAITKLASITGIKEGLSDSQFNIFAGLSGSNFVLDGRALNEEDGAEIKLTNIGDTSYTLGLVSGIGTISAAQATAVTALNFEDSQNGNIAVKTTRDEGWLAGSSIGNLSFKFYEGIDTVLASVSGLSSNNISDTNIKLQSATTGGASTVIALGTSALGKEDIVLTNTGTNNYSLALADDDTDHNGRDSIVGFGGDSNSWSTDSVAGTAIWQSFTNEGWELVAANKIKYTAQEDTYKDLVTVSGLSKGFSVGSLSINTTDRVISIGESALGTTTISVAKGKDGSVDYTLQFRDETGGLSLSADGLKIGFADDDPVWKVNKGTATLSYHTAEGWSIGTDGKITYTKEKDTPLATITGLSVATDSAAFNNVITSLADSDAKYNGTIKINKDWLVSNKNVSIKVETANDADYKLELAGGGASDSKAEYGHDDKGKKWTLKDGVATYIQSIGEGWTISDDGLRATYDKATTQNLLTISNINSSAKVTGGGISISGISLAGTSFILSPGALTQDVSKPNVLINAEGSKYTITIAGISTNGTSGFVDEDPKWKIDGTTATYQFDTGEGWTLDEDDNSISYTAKVTTPLAKLTGLKSGITASSASTIISVDDTTGVITLGASALAQTDVNLETLTKIDGKTNYTFALKAGIPTSGTEENVLKYSNGTATFDNITTEYYEAQGDVIKYTPEGTNKTLASIKGLASGLVVGTDSTATPSTTTVIGLAKDENGVVKKDDIVAKIDNGKIILSDGALNKTNIELTSDTYKLELNMVPSPEHVNKSWTISNTTATFKANVLAGYTTATDGKKITYTPTKTGVTLLTITGLNKTELANRGAKTGVASIDGVIVDENNHTVSIDKELFGTSTLKVTGKTEAGEDYTLQIDGNEVYSKGEAPEEQDIWTLSGTTAVYKRVTPAYYSMEADGTVKYHAQVGVKVDTSKKNSKDIVYATIKGLKSGLELNKEEVKIGTETYKAGELIGNYITNSSGTKEFKSLITIDELGTAYGTITLDKNVLGTTKVTLTDGNTGKYSLAFKYKDESGQDITVGTGTDAKKITFTPQRSNYTWEVSKNTSAILKADISGGYTLAANSKSITYSAEKKASTILTITGLKNGIETITKDNKNNVSTSTETTETTNFIGIYDADNGFKAIEFTDATYNDHNKVATDDDGNNPKKGEITLPDAVLGTTSIATKSTDYVFKNDDKNDNESTYTNGTTSIKILDYSTSSNPITPATVNKWRVSGTTAKYTTYMPAYYSFNANSNSVVYHKEAVVKSNRKDLDLATVSNLPKGLKVGPIKDDSGKDRTKELGVYSADGTTFTPYVELDDNNKIITVKDVALAKKNIALKNSNYTIALEDESKHAQINDSSIWSMSGSTATLKIAKSEGYEIDSTNNTIKYLASDKGKVALTISGLAKGLKPSKAGDKDSNNKEYKAGEALGTYDADGKFNAVITLDGKEVNLEKEAFGTSTVTFSTKKGYDGYSWDTNDLIKGDGSGSIEAKENAEFWSISGTTATFSKGTNAGFKVYEDNKGNKNPNKLTHTGAKATDTLVKLSGLAKGLKVDAFGNIAGIEVNDKTITLSANVLNQKNKVASSSSGYELALGSDVKKQEENKAVWYVTKGSNSTSIINYGAKGKTEGYALNANKTEVSYKNVEADSSPTLTITGLKNGIKTKADGTVDGIAFDPSDATKIILSKSVLGTKTVEITKGGKSDSNSSGYTLAIDNKSVTEVKPEYKWFISGTTATYKQSIPKGYYEEGGVIKYSSKATTGSALITISGLKKGLKVVDGEIEGITYNSSSSNKTVTVDSRVLGTTNVKINDGYELALETSNDYKVEEPIKDKQWTISGTMATYCDETTTTKGYELVKDSNSKATSIKYTAAKNGKALATVRGLASGLEVKTTKDNSGVKSEVYLKTDTNKTNLISFNATTTGQIDLKDGALGTAVTVTGKYDNTTDYTIHYAGTNNGTSDGEWSYSNGTATYTVTTNNEYETSTDKKKISLKSAGGKTTVTITGLKDDLTFSNSDSDPITFKDGVFTVKNSNALAGLSGNKVVQINGGNYKLALDSDVNQNKTIKHEWKVSNGTANYLEQVEDGGYYCDGVTISKVDATTTKTLATITGLPTTITKLEEPTGSDATANPNTYGYYYKATPDATTETYKPLITVDNTNRTFTLAKEALTTNARTNMTVTGNYTFKIADKTVGTGADAKTETVVNMDKKATAESWVLNGTTATYKTGPAAYYELTNNDRTIKYTAANPKSILAAVSGFSKSGLTAESINAGISVASIDGSGTGDSIKYSFTLADSLLGKDDIKFTNNGNNKYQISLSGGSSAGGDPTDNQWYIKDSNVYYTSGKEESWSINSSGVVKYTGASLNTDSYDAKIGGLKLGSTLVTDNKIAGIGIDTTTSVISLNEDVLDKKAVSLQSTSYKLALTGVNTVSNTSIQISITGGGKANVVSLTPEYYDATSNSTLVSYNKEDISPFVTITGLNNTVTADNLALDTDNEKVTLSKAALGTSSVSISSGYKFVLGSDVPTDNDKKYSFVISGTTATFKESVGSSYSLSADSVSVAYDPGSKASDIVKLTGLKKGLTVTDGVAEGISYELPADSLSTGKIVVNGDAVGTTTIKLSGAKASDYVLATENVPEPEPSDEYWAYNGTTATYKGKLSDGFTLTDDKTLTYSKVNTSADLAKVTGLLNNTIKLDADDGSIIRLSASEIKKSVAVDGKNRYEFDIAGDYDEGIITGSTGNDTITVNGFGVTVNGNRGNDYITLYGEGTKEIDGKTVTVGDLYVYSGGNDVLVDFSGSLDSIRSANSSYDITKSSTTITAVSLDSDNKVDDVIIKFDSNNSIVLKDFKEGTDFSASVNHIIFGGLTYSLSGSDDSLKAVQLTVTSANAPGYAFEDYGNFSLTPTLKDSNVIIAGGGDKKK